jgi:hypothetical protein
MTRFLLFVAETATVAALFGLAIYGLPLAAVALGWAGR